jgi:hypothetical protein
MRLIQDLREFIELLNSENVQYLVIGGWAYNRYAEPRVTGDIDFFRSAAPENQALLRRVLEKFGFGPALPPTNRPLFRKKILMLGRPPNRIDLAIAIDGLTFEEAWENRQRGDLDGMSAWFISLPDLIRNKQAANRDKDQLDVKMLKRMSGAS